MNSIVLSFLLRVLVFTGIAFGLHLVVLNSLGLPLFENKIVLAYIVNLVFGIIMFCVLYFFREKYKNQLGFIFLFGSMVKFALFFLLFYGSYHQDGLIEKTEFFAFFIPYALTLVLEVFSLSKWMNEM